MGAWVGLIIAYKTVIGFFDQNLDYSPRKSIVLSDAIL